MLLLLLFFVVVVFFAYFFFCFLFVFFVQSSECQSNKTKDDKHRVLGQEHLAIKCHLLFAADDNFKCCCFFKNNNKGLTFHANRLLADHSHEISYLIFSKIKKDVAKCVVCCSRYWR